MLLEPTVERRRRNRLDENELDLDRKNRINLDRIRLLLEPLVQKNRLGLRQQEWIDNEDPLGQLRPLWQLRRLCLVLVRTRHPLYDTDERDGFGLDLRGFQQVWCLDEPLVNTNRFGLGQLISINDHDAFQDIKSWPWICELELILIRARNPFNDRYKRGVSRRDIRRWFNICRLDEPLINPDRFGLGQQVRINNRLAFRQLRNRLWLKVLLKPIERDFFFN